MLRVSPYGSNSQNGHSSARLRWILMKFVLQVLQGLTQLGQVSQNVWTQNGCVGPFLQISLFCLWTNLDENWYSDRVFDADSKTIIILGCHNSTFRDIRVLPRRPITDARRRLWSFAPVFDFFPSMVITLHVFNQSIPKLNWWWMMVLTTWRSVFRSFWSWLLICRSKNR